MSRRGAAARRLAATALRDCTTCLDTSASLTNTVFSLFYPHATAPVTRTRVDTPREFYKIYKPRGRLYTYTVRPHQTLYYTRITYLLYAVLMTAPAPPSHQGLFHPITMYIISLVLFNYRRSRDGCRHRRRHCSPRRRHCC